MKIGQKGSAGDTYTPVTRAKRGRPKKKPDYDRSKEIDDLVQQAVTLFKVPFDDRVKRPQNAPSIKTVAEQMDTSRVRLKKLLITAGYYSTEMSRKVQSLSDQGVSIEEICEKTGLSNAGVNALLPYKRGAYNLKDPPLPAENLRVLRKRKKACENLIQQLENNESEKTCCKSLWETLDLFQNYPFRKGNNEAEDSQVVEDSQGEKDSQGENESLVEDESLAMYEPWEVNEPQEPQKPQKSQKFKYTIETNCDCDSEWLCMEGSCERSRYSRAEVEEAFYKIRKVQREEGRVTNENRPCCEELYTIFLRIGACHC